jgi:predicted amidohydrolase YtcJ
MKLDKLIYANIYSMDLENPQYRALGIKDGKVAFLGSEKEAKEQSAAEIMDLTEKTIFMRVLIAESILK